MAFNMKKKLNTDGLTNNEQPIKTEVLPEVDLGLVTKTRKPTYEGHQFAHIAEIHKGKDLLTKGKTDKSIGFFEAVNPALKPEEAKAGKPVPESSWFSRYYSDPEAQEAIQKQAKTAKGTKFSLKTIKEMAETAKQARILSGQAPEHGYASVVTSYEPKTGLYRNIGVGTSFDPKTGQEIGAEGPKLSHELTHFTGLDAAMGQTLVNFIGGDVMKATRDANLSKSQREYLSRPEELYGNFNELRARINHEFGKKYDAESLKKLIKEDPGIKDELFFKAFGEEETIKALNTIAKVEEKNTIMSNFREA